MASQITAFLESLILDDRLIIVITTSVVVLPSVTLAVSKKQWIRGFASGSIIVDVEVFASSIVKVATGGIVLVKVLTDVIDQECRIWNDAVADFLVECHCTVAAVDSLFGMWWNAGCK